MPASGSLLHWPANLVECHHTNSLGQQVKFVGFDLRMSVKKTVSGLGATIRHLREASRLTQKQLGQIAGMQEAAVGRLEKNPDNRPRLDTLQKLAGALGVTVAELVKDVPVIAPVDQSPPASDG